MDLHSSPIGLGEAMASKLDKDVAASLLNLVDPSSQLVTSHTVIHPYNPTAQNQRNPLKKQASMPLVCPAAALTLALESPSPQRPSTSCLRPETSGRLTTDGGDHSVSSIEPGGSMPSLFSLRPSSKPPRLCKNVSGNGRRGSEATDGVGSSRVRLSMSNMTRIFTGLLDNSSCPPSPVPLPAPASAVNRCDTGAVTQALLKDACENWFFNIFELQVGCH